MEQQPQEPEEGWRKQEPSEHDPGWEGPSIYVASLADYNAGRLHGQWLPADVGHTELETGVKLMLAASPIPGAEEFAIFDYEGFGPVRLGEYEPLTTVTTIAHGIAEHGPAFAHWAALVGTSDLGELDDFEDAYRGHFASVTAYAEELMDDYGANRYIEAMPEYLQPYVKLDVASFARDLELSGDIATSEGDGGVYVFDGQ
jgi:antirestriction protein